MKVISLLQPWASLVVSGHKKIETRSWNTKYRGPLLIHASKKSDGFNRQLYYQWREGFRLNTPAWEELPFGAIIGQVNLVDTETSENIAANLPKSIYWGVDKELAFGDYSFNRYGWYLSNPVQFPAIIPAKGQLGIWEYDLPEKIGFSLLGGGHASFEGMPTRETVEALEKMVEVARQSKLF
jgi:hypothetical protein